MYEKIEKIRFVVKDYDDFGNLYFRYVYEVDCTGLLRCFIYMKQEQKAIDSAKAKVPCEEYLKLCKRLQHCFDTYDSLDKRDSSVSSEITLFYFCGITLKMDGCISNSKDYIGVIMARFLSKYLGKEDGE